MKNTLILFSFLFLTSMANWAQADGINLSGRPCSIEKGSKILSVPSLNNKFTLAGIASSTSLDCHLVEFKTFRFLEVHYSTRQDISYSGGEKELKKVEVIKLGTKTEMLISEELTPQGAVWKEMYEHLVLRMKGTEQGKTVFLESYVFDPTKNLFSDLDVFGGRNGWQILD